MENEIGPNELIEWIAIHIPEARQEFISMPDRVAIGHVLNRLFDLTSTLISQHKFRAVKRCLNAAENLLKAGDNQVKTAVSSIYMYRLATLLSKQDAESEFIHFLLPTGLRTELYRNAYPDE